LSRADSEHFVWVRNMETLWAILHSRTGSKSKRHVVVDATLNADDDTSTVVIEDQNTHESIMELGAKDVEWMYSGFTCACCGVRERKLLVSTDSADASSKKFYKKYSMLRAVEAGEDVRKVARMEVALKNGDWITIGLRCGDNDEQVGFQAFSKAVVSATELTVRQEVNCRSQRKKQTPEESSAAMEGEGGDRTDADRHMQELLNELSLEEMRTPAKSKRKNKKNKTMSTSYDINCPSFDASDAGTTSVSADQTQENIASSPEASTDDQDMHDLAADADATSIANSGRDMSEGGDFADHLVSVESCSIVEGPGDEDVGLNNDASTDEWETAYSSAKIRRKNKRRMDVASEAPAPVTPEITNLVSGGSDDQICASSLFATAKAAPVAASDTEESVVSADGRPSAYKEFDDDTGVHSYGRCFDERTERTRIPSETGTHSPAASICAEMSDSASPRHREAAEACQSSTSQYTPRSVPISDGPDALWRCLGTEEIDDVFSERPQLSGSHDGRISIFGSDSGQDAMSQVVQPSTLVAFQASSGFSQPCHSTVLQGVCDTVPSVVGGGSKESSQTGGQTQIATCPWDISAQESSQYHGHETEQCNHLISVDSCDEDVVDVAEDSDVSGAVSEVQFVAGVGDFRESLSYWVDPNCQPLHFIAPAFVPDECLGFDTFTFEKSSLYIPTAPEQSDSSSDGSFPTYISNSSKCLGSPMKVHVASMPPMRMSQSEPMKVDTSRCLRQSLATGIATLAHSVCTAEPLKQSRVGSPVADRAPTLAADPPCSLAGSERLLRAALEEEICCTEARLLNLRRRLQQLC